MKGQRFLILALCPILLGGCATPQIYEGRALDCEGNVVVDAEIEAWKNQWRPLATPRLLARASTDQSGHFRFRTEERASFFVYSGKELEVSSHPNKSDSKCQ